MGGGFEEESGARRWHGGSVLRFDRSEGSQARSWEEGDSLKLFSDLTAIVEQIESALRIRLTDEDFAHGRDEMLHVFLHEACHAAVSHSVPWIRELHDRDHTALDEVLARLLEEEVGRVLGLPVHTADEQVRELVRYPVTITMEQYKHLRARWQQQYWPARDVEGMATYALGYLRREHAIGG